MELKIEEKKRT